MVLSVGRPLRMNSPSALSGNQRVTFWSGQTTAAFAEGVQHAGTAGARQRAGLMYSRGNRKSRKKPHKCLWRSRYRQVYCKWHRAE